MWILDHELRLITPADPLFGAEEGDVPRRRRGRSITSSRTIISSPTCCTWFQDQQKSLRGRAPELRLQEFALGLVREAQGQVPSLAPDMGRPSAANRPQAMVGRGAGDDAGRRRT